MSTPGMQDPNQSNFQALTLRDLLGVLKRRQWLIYINIILFLAVGAIYTYFIQETSWEKQAAVLVKPDPRAANSSSPDVIIPELVGSQTYDVRTFFDLYQTEVNPLVLEKANEILNLAFTPTDGQDTINPDPRAKVLLDDIQATTRSSERQKIECLYNGYLFITNQIPVLFTGDEEAYVRERNSWIQNESEECGGDLETYYTENLPSIRALPPSEGSNLLAFNIVADDQNLIPVFQAAIYYSMLDFSNTGRTDAIKDAQSFLQDSLEEIEGDLDVLREDEKALKDAYGITNFGSELELRQQRLAEANSVLASAETNYLSAQEALNTAERSLATLQVESPTREVTQTQTNLSQVLQAENDLEALQLQKEALLVRFFPDAQPVQAVEAQIEAKQQQIDTLRENLTTVSVIENPLIATYEQRVEDAKVAAAAAEERYERALEQHRDANRSLIALNDMQSEFDRLASRRVALQERQQQQNQLLQVLNLRVNDIRTPLEFLPGGAIEESGSEQGNFIAAGFLGLLVGLVVAFSKESLDRTYHNPIELARHVQRDILARVPKRPSSERALITNPSEAASFESYRLLASNLIARLARQGVEKPVTVVSSAEPNVGKTTVAANLATAVALRGNKTVLIDAAFRNPSLHEVFDLENGEGLVNALKDTAADPTKLVQATSSEQLSVLTTGSGIEESSIDLLETNRMGEIVQALSKEFDYVLVDVARAVPFADASNVARYANSGLIVFDEKKQDPDLISEAIGALEMQGAPVVGLVVNKAKKAKDLLAQK